MKKLLSYEGKKVIITSCSGNIFTGNVTCYFDKEENAPDFKEDGIVLENVTIKQGSTKEKKVLGPMEFHESDIVNIEIIN